MKTDVNNNVISMSLSASTTFVTFTIYVVLTARLRRCIDIDNRQSKAHFSPPIKLDSSPINVAAL